MTELFLRTIASRGPGGRVRALAVPLYAIALALFGAAWLGLVDSAQGVALTTGDVGLGSVLRTALLATPLMIAAVWAALSVTRRRLAGDASVTVKAVAVTFAVAAAGAVAAAVAGLVAGAVMSASGGAYDGSALAFLAGRAALAFPACLVAAGLVTLVLLKAQPWAQAVRDRAPRRTRMAHGVTAVAGLGAAFLAVTAVMGQSVASTASASGSPGNPCPTGTPIRDYSVRAIDLSIPLNRFGDHDPNGKMYVLTGYGDPAAVRHVGDGQAASLLPTNLLTKVRAQEASKHVSIGLEDDPIQPLVMRANQGECVEVQLTVDPSFTGGRIGMHIDGLSYGVGSSGDDFGANADSTTGVGTTQVFRYYVPDDPTIEGARYIRPGEARALVDHGLFGSLVVEPKGSTYLDNYTGKPNPSGWGWEAMIVPPSKKAFREHVKQFHEIGNEKENAVLDKNNKPLPTVDPITTSYRPGTRAYNYRSEPFMNRLIREHRAKSLAYNSFTFADPATAMPRSYLGDPTKIRLVHAGAEMLHVYHLHGGGIRWRLNPEADPTFDYQETGLKKHPVVNSDSQRLDAQSQAPGDSFNLEIEGGAGGVQQSAGDFLFHCHIAKHYVSGMWGFWRTYDTLQPDLAVLPDRSALPEAVTSDKLIGKTFNGQTISNASDLDKWIRPQIPAQGVPAQATPAHPEADWDGSVWNWTIDNSNPAAPVYLGAPESTNDGLATPQAWPDLFNAQDVSRPWDPNGQARALAGHPGMYVNDIPVSSPSGNRPAILFNPTNGRPAYPLLRPQIGQRAPFSPNGHMGAPWLGDRADRTVAPGQIDPYANRPDGLCPTGSQDAKYNIVSLSLPIQITKKGATDPLGKLYTRAAEKAAVLAGGADNPKRTPLIIRINEGQCARVTLTSEQTDDSEQPFSMTNLHIHHVQFDVQASDGVGTGLAFGQAVRPYKLEDAQLASAAAAGDTTITLTDTPLTSAIGFSKYRVGVYIAVGEGTESIEVHRITAVNGQDITLEAPLTSDHAAGQWAGDEFVQETWFPDANIDNIFWHDHVDGIHNWGHGLVSQLIVEPKGSTYHDPVTGQEILSGPIADIHATNPLIPGIIDGSFREFAMLSIDENALSGVDSTINLRAEPFADRLSGGGPAANPSNIYSSYAHGDPYTPLPRAYVGDPFVIRSINVGPSPDTTVVDGHRFTADTRLKRADGKTFASTSDAYVNGVSERFTVAFKGGAGGPLSQAGDFLYRNGQGRRFVQGAWGLIRVYDTQRGDLQPLPGTTVKQGVVNDPTPTNGAPPDQSGDPGDPCPTAAKVHSFDVSAVNIPKTTTSTSDGITEAFVPTAQAAAAKSGAMTVDPLVLHVAKGECVQVTLKNELTGSQRVSFHAAELDRTVRSSGINIGYSSEQTVAPGGTRVYRYYANDDSTGTALVSDFGGADTGPLGLYGAINVAPEGATFRDSLTGQPKDVGTQVDVIVPGKDAYRDMTVVLADNDPVIGQSGMPYPDKITNLAVINNRAVTTAAAGADLWNSYSNAANGGDPSTFVFRARAGDHVVAHALGAPGSEQIHQFSMGGQAWYRDPLVPHSEELTAERIGAGMAIDCDILGGAGGVSHEPGDYFVGDLRRPFMQAGLWGILRVEAASGDTGSSLQALPVFSTPGGSNGGGSNGGGSSAGGSYGGGTTATPGKGKDDLSVSVSGKNVRKHGLRVTIRAAKGGRAVIVVRRAGKKSILLRKTVTLHKGLNVIVLRSGRLDNGSFVVDVTASGRHLTRTIRVHS